MYHPVLVGGQLNECAEVHDTDHLALKYHAGFYVCNDSGNDGDCLVNHGLIRTAYVYGSIIGNVNLDTGLFNNLIDDLALLSYHIANLLRINGNLLNLGGVWA